MKLAVKDAARLLNVSEKTIYRWIADGKIPAHQIGDQYRFNRAELLEWATAQRINVSPEILSEPETNGVLLPAVVEAMRVGGIYYRIAGRDKPSVLRSVVDILQLPEEVDRQFLYDVLLAREALGSTGIGEGIAIPHVRNPIVLHLPRPMITLCFLEHAIDFGALDGKPVQVLFTIISPTIRAHLHMLSRLMYLLHDKQFRSALARQRSREELLEQAARVEASLDRSAAAPVSKKKLSEISR
ncbi:MAG: PTS sugar transporter subunit IIA [Phycisphaerales bacterium]|nr:PTS sugar transporter subunit IIA [Phycisphaerales bacterium]